MNQRINKSKFIIIIFLTLGIFWATIEGCITPKSKNEIPPGSSPAKVTPAPQTEKKESPKPKGPVQILPPPVVSEPPLDPVKVKVFDSFNRIEFSLPDGNWKRISPVEKALLTVERRDVSKRVTGTFSLNVEFLMNPVDINEYLSAWLKVESERLKKLYPRSEGISSKPFDMPLVKGIKTTLMEKLQEGKRRVTHIIFTRGQRLFRSILVTPEIDYIDTELEFESMIKGIIFLDGQLKPIQYTTQLINPRRTEDFRFLARTYFKNHSFWDYQQAIRYTEKIMEADPNNYIAGSELAEYYAFLSLWIKNHKGNPGEYLTKAVSNSIRTLSANPNLLPAYRGLAICYYIQGRTQEAEAEIVKALKISTEDPSNYLVYSIIITQDLPRKINYLERVIQLEEDNLLAHLELGRTYEAMESITDALKEFKKTIDINTKSAEAHHHLGRIYMDNEMTLQEAISEFNAAIMNDPGLSDSYFNLAVIYKKIGKLDEAIIACRRVININPHDSAAQNFLGGIYRTKKMFNEAARVYYLALTADPNYPAPYFNLGLLYAQDLNNIPYARAYFEKFIALESKGERAEAVREWLARNK